MSSETTTRRVVLLFGAGGDSEESAALASESSRLASLLDSTTSPADVSIISLGLTRKIAGTTAHIRLDESSRSLTDRLLAAVGAYTLNARFSAFPLGRLLNSLGPVDPSRVFWRTLKGHPAAVRLLTSANVVIATDLAATKTAWLAVHRGWVENAFYDHRAASVGVSWQLPAVDTNPQF